MSFYPPSLVRTHLGAQNHPRGHELEGAAILILPHSLRFGVGQGGGPRRTRGMMSPMGHLAILDRQRHAPPVRPPVRVFASSSS
jgi:hypothetical protein